jgi:transposase
MSMSRKFRTANYDETLHLSVTLRDALPPNHLARFVVDVVSQLDVGTIYARYASRGGAAFAPEILLGLLLYGDAPGVFSARKMERATDERLPLRCLAGNLHPDHDTIAHFRNAFLSEMQELFVHILLLAQTAGGLQLGNLSLDGTKLHAAASKSQAVSDKRLMALEAQWRQDVQELLTLGEHADRGDRPLPPGVSVADEVALRAARLANLAQAKTVLDARAQERYQAEKAAYEAKRRAREAPAQRRKRRPRGRHPQPPQPGPRDTDHYHCTDPDARIMQNSANDGFDQHDTAQVAVTQDTLLLVASTLSHHPTDHHEAAPTLDAIAPAVGPPDAVAMANGYCSAATLQACAQRGLAPYIATGRAPHHKTWRLCFAEPPEPPPTAASLKVKMAYKLPTEMGHALYRLRKCTVEPVIGLIKAVLGFRQLSLRGLTAAAGAWGLVCLAFNLKRLHILLGA